MPDQPMYHSQVIDHLGLVAGMVDELGMGEIIDQATRRIAPPVAPPLARAIQAPRLATAGVPDR